jgi:PKHD-type hydroxylase
MLLTIPNLLNPAQLDKMREIVADGRFVDGKLTAGFAAARVKHNEELGQEPERLQR